MGLSLSLIPGAHFPLVTEDPPTPLIELDKRNPFETNHLSFSSFPDGADTDARPPAWDLLEEQVNNGFAMLFPVFSGVMLVFYLFVIGF